MSHSQSIKPKGIIFGQIPQPFKSSAVDADFVYTWMRFCLRACLRVWACKSLELHQKLTGNAECDSELYRATSGWNSVTTVAFSSG